MVLHIVNILAILLLTNGPLVFAWGDDGVNGQGGDRRWAQCGGIPGTPGQNWNGDTSCPPGWGCQCQNPYYSQCLQGPPTPCQGGSQVGGNPANNSNPVPVETSDSNQILTGPGPGTSSAPPSLGTGGPSWRNSQLNGLGSQGSQVLQDQSIDQSSVSQVAAFPAGTSAASSNIGTNDSAIEPATGNNKASTTVYGPINSSGGCQCPTNIKDWLNGGGVSTYTTAAGNGLIFQSATGDGSGCGAGCGVCYLLTNTGKTVGEDKIKDPNSLSTKTITVMITNSCPYKGNEQWCPNAGSTNQYGYGAHFDLARQPAGWGNDEVIYEKLDYCPEVFNEGYRTCKCPAASSNSQALPGFGQQTTNTSNTS